MKAIICDRYGPPDVLEFKEIEKPVPADNQMLVRVRATSVNPAEWHEMTGVPLLLVRPTTGLRRPKNNRLGSDVAGVVEAVGKDVTRFQPGDEIFGGAPGAFAEYVCIREDRAALKPANVTFEQAGSVGIAGLTALQGLRDAGQLQTGQKVLINGASGGVGTFAVQIAKSLGAEVTGVCSTRNVEIVRSLGADHVVDYTQNDFIKTGEQYDLVFDNAGSRSLRQSRRVLKRDGILVMIGGQKGRLLSPAPRILRMFIYTRFVSQQMSFMLARFKEEDLETLRELLESGEIKTVIDRTYPFDELPHAMSYLGEGHAQGKIAISVGS